MENQNNPQSARNISQLPEEIINEILPRLPVKALLRFRCVSKSWRSLISSEAFIKTHHHNSIKNPSFPHQRAIIHRRLLKPRECSLHNLLSDHIHTPMVTTVHDPVNLKLKSYRTIGCYNGLVCIVEQPGVFYLWNLSTRITNKLPLVTDSPHVWNPGFGWVESTNEYKVFCVVHGCKDGKVYSSKTNSWKTVKGGNSGTRIESGFCVSEKLHWIIGQDIICFDLKSEVFGMIKLPPNLHRERLMLGVTRGCLCVLHDHRHESGVRVWVMKEYGMKESWERVAAFSHVLELVKQPFSEALIVGPKGEILLSFGSVFLIYKLQDDVFRCPESWGDWMYPYIESLVSPVGDI